MTANGVTNEGAAGRTRTAVQLLIYSGTFEADEISFRLNLQPTRTEKKGVKYGKRTGTRVELARHMWQFSSESHVSAADFTSHLDWVLSRVFPIRERLQALRDSGAVECALVGLMWTSGTSAYARISIDHMQRLISLRLDLQLEFADYGEDD